MKTDIEIANESNLEPIGNILSEEFGVDKEVIYSYGKYIAKIPYDYNRGSEEKANLILVTAMTPTKSGEGKTTVSVGLADALHKLNKKTVVCLRQPSMGPVFGVKGGAAGGGYSQVVPMDKLNLGLTGDIDAITSANNLLSALIDNHIYQGNELGIDQNKIVWKRCLDVCDRNLRDITVGCKKKGESLSYTSHFDITAASEIMTVMVMSKSIEELKERLGDILVAYSFDGNPIFARDINAEGSLTVILKDAFNPNALQTLEHTLALIHCGPFANVSLGVNSVVNTKLGMRLADYVVTEAGFASDLGAEKFFDIKCRENNLKPSCTVLVVTTKALRHHGGAEDESVENIYALKEGTKNMIKHIRNLRDVFNQNVVVALNKFPNDSDMEIGVIERTCDDLGVPFSISTAFTEGSKGAIDLARKVIFSCEKKEGSIRYSYKYEDTVVNKIRSIAKLVYGASEIEISEEASDKISRLEKEGYGNLPICIAKTQYSFSDNAKELNVPTEFTLKVRDVELKRGSRMIVVICGSMVLMPALPKVPNAEKINYSEGVIIGLS